MGHPYTEGLWGWLSSSSNLSDVPVSHPSLFRFPKGHQGKALLNVQIERWPWLSKVQHSLFKQQSQGRYQRTMGLPYRPDISTNPIRDWVDRLVKEAPILRRYTSKSKSRTSKSRWMLARENSRPMTSMEGVLVRPVSRFVSFWQ